MASHFHSHDPSPNDIARGYEGNDLRRRLFLIFAGAFVLFGAVVQVIVWLMLVGMEDGAQAENIARFPPPLLSQSVVDVVRRPPPPNLQPSPVHPKVAWRDMDELRREQEAALEHQGWERAYPDVDLEPSQPLNQLRLPTDAVQAVAPRIASARSAGPAATQPATQRADVTGPEGAR
jgi:hypothetical protein